MAFTQQTFLGASIVGFQTSVGWGKQPSELRVTLVEDDANKIDHNGNDRAVVPSYEGLIGQPFGPFTFPNGDNFIGNEVVDIIGNPVNFVYEGGTSVNDDGGSPGKDFTFGGIIQSWQQRHSQSGDPIYEVVINDPREILGGVQLIINNYTGPTYTVPNLYNCYGLYESPIGAVWRSEFDGTQPYFKNIFSGQEDCNFHTGDTFGGSFANKTGMPWQKVMTAFMVLQGINIDPNHNWPVKPITFRGFDYIVDLYGLAVALITEGFPNNFRVPGHVISVLDLIDDLTEASGRDYFISLLFGTQGIVTANNVITVNTINRKIAPRRDIISQYVDYLDAKGILNAYDKGEQLRIETTNTFLIGAPIEFMKFTSRQSTSDQMVSGPGNVAFDETAGDTIIQYWGLNTTGDAILQDEDGNFVLDSASLRGINELNGLGPTTLGISRPYISDADEMRAVLGGQQSWESFLWAKSIDSNSIHDQKAEKLHLGESPWFFEFFDGLADADAVMNKIRETPTAIFANKTKDDIDRTVDEERSKIIYKWLADFAREYYGKKFMVTMDICAIKHKSDGFGPLVAISDSYTGKIIDTHEPNNSAWIDPDPSELTALQNADFVPSYPMHVKLTDEVGKMVCYVVYDNIGQIDLSQIPEDVYVIDNNNQIFIKCQLEAEFVYLDRSTFFSPRAVVTLPSQIVNRVNQDDKHRVYQGIIGRYLFQKYSLTEEQLKELYERIGVSEIFLDEHGNAQTPDRAAIPLKSNVLRYGPWYTNVQAVEDIPGTYAHPTGPDAREESGKTQYELDDSLNPWTYQGFSNLYSWGYFRVQQAWSSQQWEEHGSFTIPEVPTRNIGNQLITTDGAPYITDINVDIGENGALSTYKLKTWVRDFTKLAKFQEEEFKRLASMSNRWRKNVSNLLQDFRPKLGKQHTPDRIPRPPDRDDSKASHFMHMSEILVDSDTNLRRTDVVSDPIYSTVKNLKDSGKYVKRFGASMDVLFRPFTTDKSAGDAPHFEEPTADSIFDGGADPNVDDLHPFTADQWADGNDFVGSITGSAVPEKGILHQKEDNGKPGEVHRAISVRGPVIITGWGFDVDGNPVPGTGDAFIEDYKQRMDQWKSGPLDVRWDEERKVWTAGGGQCYLVKVTTEIKDGEKQDVTKVKLENGTPPLVDNGTLEDVWNFTGVTIPTYDDCEQFFEVCRVNGVGYVIQFYGVTTQEVLTNFVVGGTTAQLQTAKFAFHQGKCEVKGDICCPDSKLVPTTDCVVETAAES
jgi:hypothetical protein